MENRLLTIRRRPNWQQGSNDLGSWLQIPQKTFGLVLQQL